MDKLTLYFQVIQGPVQANYPMSKFIYPMSKQNVWFLPIFGIMSILSMVQGSKSNQNCDRCQERKAGFALLECPTARQTLEPLNGVWKS